MKKKKLEGLSLSKNVISRLGGLNVKGGHLGTTTNCGFPGTRDCPANSAATPCFSRNCVVLTGECGETDMGCKSIHVACE